MAEEKLTELPKEKEKEEIFRGVKFVHIIAGFMAVAVVAWLYAESTPFREIIQKNMIFIFGGIILLISWFTSRGKKDIPIGMIKAKELCREWVEHNQKIKDMPSGNIKIEQSKRKKEDLKPKEYLFDVRIETDEKPNSFLISVDSKIGDVTLSEPAIITRISEESEAQDVFLEKKKLKKEEEWEQL